MSDSQIPAPMLKVLAAATGLTGKVLKFVWAYIALSLLGLALAYANIQMPASRSLIDAWDEHGMVLLVMTALLTLGQRLAAAIVNRQRSRQPQ